LASFKSHLLLATTHRWGVLHLGDLFLADHGGEKGTRKIEIEGNGMDMERCAGKKRSMVLRIELLLGVDGGSDRQRVARHCRSVADATGGKGSSALPHHRDHVISAM
jgi:hypothetical protein